MSKKEIYKAKNIQFVKELSAQPDVLLLPGGIYYKVITSGTGSTTPTPRSIVTVHYKGSLIDGKVFDDSYARQCPEAFRLCDLIDGWQIALRSMHEGDKWIIYVPYEKGYGTKASGPIPAFSTLIFEIELIKIA